MSAERQLSTVISTNVTMPHMGHISKAIEAESSPSPRGPNSSKSVKPFDERNQKELAYTKLKDPGKPGRTETKSGRSPGNRPQARKNLKAENGKGPNIQTATTSTGYLGAYPAKSLTEQLPTHSEKRRQTDGRRGQGRETDSGRSEGGESERVSYARSFERT